LQKSGLIPKEEETPEGSIIPANEFEIVEVDIEVLESKLQDKEILHQIYRYIEQDEEEYDV
jgi:hypothetical protein